MEKDIPCKWKSNDEKSEREIKETLSFTIATKRMKYLGINLPKETKDLYPENYKTVMKEIKDGASLVEQWLRVCLPVQGTWVRALVWEDPTCRGVAGPVSHNY